MSAPNKWTLQLTRRANGRLELCMVAPGKNRMRVDVKTLEDMAKAARGLMFAATTYQGVEIQKEPK